MNRELLFAKTLENVRKLAKEQGNAVSEQQVMEAFEPLELNGDQMQMVYDYLIKHKVGIGQPVNIDDYLSDEEKNYLEEYIKELEELPVYTEGQKQAATISAMAGEADAQNMLTEMYLREVVDLAKLYTGQGVLLEDLIGEGNVALAFGVTMLGSLEKPEEAQGMLGRMIMDAMEQYIEENAENDKRDRKVADKVNKVNDKAKELSEDLHRKVTVDELAAETGMSKSYIRDAMRMSGFKIDYLETEEEE
ncbi:MAG: hypothetical protein IKL04_09775 [Lachnospiraceae bacterium]|nr:hypothetical protein [Lachnospiraceae bacterium]